MLSQKRQFRRVLLRTIDGLLFVVALLAAYQLRASLGGGELPELEEFEKYLWLTPVVFVLAPVFLAGQSLYEERAVWSHRGEALGILRASLYLSLSLIILLFLVRVQYARSVIILVGVIGALLVCLRHELTHWTAATRLRGRRLRTLWVGRAEDLAFIRSRLGAAEASGMDLLPDVEPDSCTPEEMTRLLHEKAVNLVIFSFAGTDNERLGGLIAACEREGVEIVLRPGLLSSVPHRLVAEVLAGEPVFLLRAQGAAPNQLLLKQAMDYLGAFVLLILLSPVLLLVWLLVRLSSPGPALYRQTRAGLNGQPFTLYKFRSMRAEADREKESLAALNEMQGPVFKIARDPRVTPIGRLLRRHSLDELPQLWNVLRGEMSLVGPRPLPVEEVGRIADNAQRRRLSVKPGLTCLWQIQGRNDIASFEDWVCLDLRYIDSWSLGLDIWILLATIPVILFGKGGR